MKNAKSDKDCEINEKKCGDNKETNFCVPKDEKCPITSIEISKNNPF